MLYNIFFFIITLMLVIPMSIKGIGTPILSFPFIFVLFCFFVLKNKPNVISKEIACCLFIYLLFVVFVAVVPFFHSTYSYDLLIFVLYGLFVFISSIMLVVCYRCHYNFNFQYIILRNLYLVGSLNALVTIFVLLNADVRDFVYFIIDTSPKNEAHLTSGVRSSGLFFFGGSIMSLFQCLVIYIGIVYVKYKKSYIGNQFFIFDVILIVSNIFAVFLAGRMGVLILLAGFFIIFVTPSSFVRGDKNIVFKTMLLTLSILASIVVFFYEEFQRLLEWAFELFINMLSGGEVTTASTEELKAMYHFPSDMIFGEGIYSTTELLIDSGYVLLTWYFGVVALLVILGLFLAHFLVVLRTNKNRDVLAIYLFCLVLILIGNFKDNYLFGSNGLTQIYFISMLLCLFSVGSVRKVTSKKNH